MILPLAEPLVFREERELGYKMTALKPKQTRLLEVEKRKNNQIMFQFDSLYVDFFFHTAENK